MTLIKHYPKSINQMFDDLLMNFNETWKTEVTESNFMPQVNIHETNEGYHVELNAPGRNKEEFKINVENNILTISFEKAEEKDVKEYKTIRREFNYETFKRSFTLNEKMNIENIQAKYDNGILKLFVPKIEEVKILPKQITIQ
ncbi:MAG TPA: Hsp20/alpha crystallin family protein [Chitinophagaceae bacterium]|nr:Hsp20/alpha crystallin family protein [Chitinophagaceae bacterium]HMZ46447.1 Hsp20/alpha crystallin family protein [Chitinophagaceae bacterium]HNE92769.1 Hsp20/alpha crystallin family protein [Chitinophagaceae bacterium]HNJ58300.1 Hsp20/alpha crystallin family protein [Chitinophagaceae bacterium]HNL82585.1 Hsp20/alpha crystallin family protein [Chitinophagaceae bacterium]